MAVVAEMNAGSLCGVITVDIKDLDVASDNILGWLLANPTYISRFGWGWTLTRKRLLGELSNLVLLIAEV